MEFLIFLGIVLVCVAVWRLGRYQKDQSKKLTITMPPCPQCGSPLKYVKSAQSDVCYDCGFSQKVIRPENSIDNVHQTKTDKTMVMDKIKDFNQIVIFTFLIIIIVSVVYNFFIDNIYCAGSKDLQQATCDAVRSAAQLERMLGGESDGFDSKARKYCFCGYR